MASLEGFFKRAAKSIPPGTGRKDSSGVTLLPETFKKPMRKRKHIGAFGTGAETGKGNAKGLIQQADQPTPIMMLARFLDAEQDIANLDDLQDFSALGHDLDPMAVEPLPLEVA